MMGDNLYIGIDTGTQGTKGVVFSERKCSVIAESYVPYDLIENERGGREQDPATWVDACSGVIQALLANSSVNPLEIRSIGVSGQQHGMVPLDSAGRVIRPAKLWCDTETALQCDTITHRAGGEECVRELIGNQVAAGFTASKILWLLENEPGNYDRLTTVLLPHDYINYWLTGEMRTECGDASGSAYFDIENRTWSNRMLDVIDPGGKLKSCTPELIDSAEPCGMLRPELAKEFGLSREILISSGGGDNMMAAIGTGNVKEGIVTVSLGTSGTIYAYSATPRIDERGEMAAFCSSTGGWLPLVCTMNVTVATELMRNMWGLELEQLNNLVELTSPGAEGLLLLPYFNGERTPALPLATATITGMTSMNMRRELFCRAAMEGATFGLRYGFDVMQRNGIRSEEIRVTGGGARSPQWRQMVADIFNCEVVGLLQEEAGATGAALQAFWCREQYRGSGVTIEEITVRMVALDEASRRSPNRHSATKYQPLYQKYLELNEKMAPGALHMEQ